MKRNQPELRDDEILDEAGASFPDETGPAFLSEDRAEAIGYVENDDTPPDFTYWDEHREPDPEPNRPVLKPRHKELARLHALGWTNNQICEKLGYSTSRVSILLGNPVIQREVDRYRNRLYEKDLVNAIKDLGHQSLEVIEEMITSPKERLKDRAETAKWVVEKVTGKPKQEVSHESNTLSAFMDMMRQMREEANGIRELPPAAGEPHVLEGQSEPVPQEGGGQKSGTRFDSRLSELLDD